MILITYFTLKITKVNLARHRDLGQNVLNTGFALCMPVLQRILNITLHSQNELFYRFSFTLYLKDGKHLYCAVKCLMVFS